MGTCDVRYSYLKHQGARVFAGALAPVGWREHLPGGNSSARTYLHAATQSLPSAIRSGRSMVRGSPGGKLKSVVRKVVHVLVRHKNEIAVVMERLLAARKSLPRVAALDSDTEDTEAAVAVETFEVLLAGITSTYREKRDLQLHLEPEVLARGQVALSELETLRASTERELNIAYVQSLAALYRALLAVDALSHR